MDELQETLADLQAARALIASPEHWTQGAMARNYAGEVISPYSVEACQWCATGAILRVQGENQPYARYTRVLMPLFAVTTGPTIIEVNDGQGYRAVLAMFDAAIANVKADIQQKSVS